MKKKAVILLAGLFALLGAACLSMARVMHGEEYVAAARAQSLYKLDIAQSRGTIYDCGLQPLVGGETEYVAAVAPTIQAIGALEKATGGQYRQQLAVALENGRPFQLVLEQPVDSPLVQVFRVPQRYSQEQLAPHVVGYLDSLGGGAAGIELAMDDVLSQCGGEISVTYRVDAVGRVLAGEEPQVVNTLEESAAGVALTLDSAIQRLAQQAAQKLGKGAVVVTEAPGCKIRAVASVPDFSPLELTFTCVGSLNAGGLQFHCVNSTAHGELDLEGALAHSCNGYFINAARVLGGQEILSMAYNLGFGSAQEFGRGLWTAAGELPTLQSLGNARALANFSFGQGELTATPLQVCAMLNAVASGGQYTAPQLLEGLVSQTRELRPLSSAAPQQAQVMQPSTARALQQALRTAAQEGTGQAAAPEGAAVGIKTGTAQTGVLENGEELLHFWYSGILWQGGVPRWCVTVLKESSASGQQAAAQVFREVAQGLLALGEEAAGS